jgi:hypothetical protein
MVLPMTFLFVGACGSDAVPGSDPWHEEPLSNNCSLLAPDACLLQEGCFLDHLGEYVYRCRPVLTDCEKITNSGGRTQCESKEACSWDPGRCYCPEGSVCKCGGGPPHSCSERCAGFAGLPCPDGYFCSQPMDWPGTGYPECSGNYDQFGRCLLVPVDCAGISDVVVCGCTSEMSPNTPHTFANACKMRMAKASYSHSGFCE